jgi:hypothetical protein
LAGAIGVAATVSVCGATTGRGATGGGAAGAAGCCLLMMAFKTSPGREIFDKSILVLISSDSGRVEREGRAEDAASPAERK